MSFVERKEYLDWLERWREKGIIKVVSGVRRAGKSTVFELFKERLRATGVKEENIVGVNFEEPKFAHIDTWEKLYDTVMGRLGTGAMNFVFLDEIQHVDGFERAIDGLYLEKNVDIYITGSNAYFMSGEIATLLTGRYVELRMLPLSFKEFSGFGRYKGIGQREVFADYIRLGSFPYVSQMGLDEKDAHDYMRGLFDTILLKDVVRRLNISDVKALEGIANFLLHNIGNRSSIHGISKSVRKDDKTVGKYIGGLTSSLLIYEARRYDIKGKQFLETQNKYYAVDAALRNLFVGGSESDIGHIIENIVYLELLRRGYDVYVGEAHNAEVDFVAKSDGRLEYYQVSATTLDENVLKRELAPLRAIADNYPKKLITLDDVFKTADYGGIEKVYLLDWLLGA